MKKLGIAVTHLGNSQLAYELIQAVNAHQGDDIAVFYETPQRPYLSANFACMQIVEAWSFAAPVIATNLTTAEKILKFPSLTKKLFLAWDLEFIRLDRPHVIPYRAFAAIYGNPSLTLLARPDHAKVIENAFNRPVVVVNGFDLPELVRIAHS